MENLDDRLLVRLGKKNIKDLKKRGNGEISVNKKHNIPIKSNNLNFIKTKNKYIDILIVNFNNLEYTKNCVEDLLNQINQYFSINLVDQNSSEEGTEEYLESVGSVVNVIRNSNNVDLNRVWNNFYETTKSEYLCFLNNDVRLTNNFTDDIIKIFDKEPDVGAVIHVTNNLNFIKTDHNLNYEILNPSLYQGWDFCLRREAYTKIPDTLRIFGGDDFLFGHLNKRGYKTALTYSSPIIHYKERTRKKMGNVIHEIQQSDIENYHIQMMKDGYRHTNSTINTNKSNKYPPEGIKLTQNKNCIYTVIIGNYDHLPELDVKKKNNWDYICFTDNKNLKSNIWKLIYVDSDYKNLLERVKLSRKYKITGIKYLLSYDNLLYVDGRIKIIGDLDNYSKNLKDNIDFVFNKHPQANSILVEMDRVLKGDMENKKMIDKIKKRYDSLNYKYDNGLFVGKFLLFKNNELTQKFLSNWWYEVENYSHRDQLSLNFVLKKNEKIKFSVIDYMNTINKFFNLTSRKQKRLIFK